MNKLFIKIKELCQSICKPFRKKKMTSPIDANGSLGKIIIEESNNVLKT